MKKILITCTAISAILFAVESKAQNWTQSGSDLVTDGLVNNVGIHDNTPIYPLTINGHMGFTPTSSAYRHIYGRSGHGLTLYGNSAFTDGPAVLLNTMGGDAQFYSTENPSSHPFAYSFIHNTGGSNYVHYMNILKNGNIGINELNPTEKLTINGSIAFTPTTASLRFIHGKSEHGLVLYGNQGWHNGSGIYLGGSVPLGGAPNMDGSISFISNKGQSASGPAFDFVLTNNSGNWQVPYLMRIFKNGQVQIGDVSIPNTNYNLVVGKGILTEKVKVALSYTSEWSDFVFADDYELMPLAEVESYIKENKHLPEVPSAEEVVKEGLDLGAMDAKLLQKIEELTLHVIQQQKEIESLKSKIK